MDEQIEESDRKLIELKHARNSFTNKFLRVPVEIIGHIFVSIITRGEVPYFQLVKKGSYNFRLVCRHWSEVASKTPELWRFWGITLKGWEGLCHRAGPPVDLVLAMHKSGQAETSLSVSAELLSLSIPLSGELKDRANQDMIRRIHLMSDIPDILGSILSCVTPDGEDVQEKSIESFVIRMPSMPIPEELSNFFARLRLPLLRHIDIYGIPEAPLWHHIKSALIGTQLTNLSLRPQESSLPLTMPQLLSILRANPNLQYLTLFGVLPRKIEDIEIPGPRLSHLRKVYLDGNFGSVLQLLKLLESPTLLDSMELIMEDAILSDIHQMFIPYMKEFFQCHDRFKEPLEVSTETTNNSILVRVFPTSCHRKAGLRISPWAEFSTYIIDQVDKLDLRHLAVDLIKCVPQEHIGSLVMEYTPEIPEDFFSAMPELNFLGLKYAELSDGFMRVDSDGQPSGWEPLPSLQSLHLAQAIVEDDNWQPLITYLEHQCPDDQTLSLYVNSVSVIPNDIYNQIQGLVGEFEYSETGWDENR